MKGSIKIWANDHDDAWNCHDVLDDPYERAPLTDGSCARLAEFAEGSGRGTPFHLRR